MTKYTISYVKPWGVEPRNGKRAYTIRVAEDIPDELSPGLIDYFSDKEPKEGDVVEGNIKLSEKGRPTFYEPYRLDRHQANITAQWAWNWASDNYEKFFADYPTTGDFDAGTGLPEVDVETMFKRLSGIAEYAFDGAMNLAEEKSE